MMKRNGRIILGTMLAGTVVFTFMMSSLVPAQDVTITDGPCTIRISAELERKPRRKVEIDQIRLFCIKDKR